MKNNENTIPLLYSILIILITTITAPVLAQSVTISAELSSMELVAGDEVDLVFTTEGETDVYFFSIETSFNADIFEFIGIQNTDLSEDGLKIADFVSPGVIGASVSRLTQLAESADGDIMILSFKVKNKAPAGISSFNFSIHTLADSEGSPIPSDLPESADFIIEESISILELTTPAMIDVTEGDEFTATGKIFANGVTIDDENSGRIRMWVGINNENNNPAGWGENAWQLMEFIDQDDDDFFNFSEDIAFQKDLGVHYVALRSDLDEDSNFRYGGINGYWHETESPSAVMEIMQQPPFRYTIAAWNFDDESLIATQSVPDNQQVEVKLFGASHSGYSSGSSGAAANSNNWHEFAEGVNYWQVVITTQNFESLRLSSKQYGSGTGPRDFQLQTSLDGINWDNVSGGSIEVANNWTSGVLDQLSLPNDLIDQPEVYIRWVQTDSLRIDQNANNTVAPGGTNRLDDIIITGINSNANRVHVWPGDTNHDGIVDEEDVLPLGINWLTHGPQPIYSSFEWEPREVEEWIPGMATYADAAGTGRIDQNDLQLVGLNFGKMHSHGNGDSGIGQQKMKSASIVQLDLEPLKTGQTTEIYLVADGGTELSGISFRMNVSGLNPDQWSVEQIVPFEWGEDWANDNRMIQFQRIQDNFLAASMIHKGFIEPEWGNNLLRIVIRAEQNWPHEVSAQLLRASVSNGYEITKLSNAKLTSDMVVSLENKDERPLLTQLLPNYPNPFNPATTIPYTLSEPGDVEIRIFDAVGRQISHITRQQLQPGRYNLDFDASSLSSGIYFYQMSANGITQTRRMTLVK